MIEPLRTRRQPIRRLAVTLALVLLALGVAFLATAVVLAHRAEPILRARLINTLSTRFDSRVELPELDISLWRSFEVTGKGLKLYPRALGSQASADQPLFAVGTFRFRTQWWNLLRSPMHVGQVSLTDLQIYRPTQEERHRIAASQTSRGQVAQKSKIEIYVDEVFIDKASLVLGTDKPGKVPLRFDIRSVRLDEVGSGQPMRFHAILVNPKPLGDIDSAGYFGPFDEHQPANSPVRGDYRFSHADLNTIKGIGGMLSSTGRYSGQLGRITVDGVTDTPNFSLDVSGSRPVPLHTSFHAIVDGMNGNTYLQPANAVLGHSHLVARGEVTRAPKPGLPGQFGRQVKLAITVAPAEVADMLRLAMRTTPPIMHGSLELTASLDLPPGAAAVPERMRLKGRFAIHNATFSNPKLQERVDQLSLRGQGNAAEANRAARAAKAGNPGESVDSQLAGDFDLRDARLTLQGLSYNVPGADIGLDGVYSLDGSQFDFRGKVRMKARLSQMVTGWRSLLLMPIDPLFAKHGARTEVPFTLNGTRAEPKFGLDLFHKEQPGQIRRRSEPETQQQ